MRSQYSKEISASVFFCALISAVPFAQLGKR